MALIIIIIITSFSPLWWFSKSLFTTVLRNTGSFGNFAWARPPLWLRILLVADVGLAKLMSRQLLSTVLTGGTVWVCEAIITVACVVVHEIYARTISTCRVLAVIKVCLTAFTSITGGTHTAKAINLIHTGSISARVRRALIYIHGAVRTVVARCTITCVASYGIYACARTEITVIINISIILLRSTLIKVTACWSVARIPRVAHAHVRTNQVPARSVPVAGVVGEAFIDVSAIRAIACVRAVACTHVVTLGIAAYCILMAIMAGHWAFVNVNTLRAVPSVAHVACTRERSIGVCTRCLKRTVVVFCTAFIDINARSIIYTHSVSINADAWSCPGRIIVRTVLQVRARFTSCLTFIRVYRKQLHCTYTFLT